jgi:ATP-dependent Clp protease ATP-binding subunit ClpC
VEKPQVSRLIGSPPGYAGYEEGGQLTNWLRRRPYSVVLLDEIEKAHSYVQHLFLQFFDSGQMADARGNLVDGRNAIFIMTTNLGARIPSGFAKPLAPGFVERMRTAIEEHFAPEFLSRIDRIIYFEPLDQDILLSIFDRQFEAVAARLREQGIGIEVNDALKRSLCQRHTDPLQGARRLQRAIEEEIVVPLTDKLLAGEIQRGMKVMVGQDIQGFRADLAPGQPPQRRSSTGLDEREAQEAQNAHIFQREAPALMARLGERGLDIEIDPHAQEFICDPFWTELPVVQALVDLIETPLLQQLEEGKFQPGDRVRVTKYADHLEFTKEAGGKA